MTLVIDRGISDPDLARLVADYLVATEREKGHDIDGPEGLPEGYRVDPVSFASGHANDDAFVARVDGMAVGCVMVTYPEAGVAEIKRLWVAPEARMGGVGRALMEAAIESARRSRATTCRLTVLRWRDSAIRLYTALGFVEVEPWDARESLVCMARVAGR